MALGENLSEPGGLAIKLSFFRRPARCVSSLCCSTRRLFSALLDFTKPRALPDRGGGGAGMVSKGPDRSARGGAANRIRRMSFQNRDLAPNDPTGLLDQSTLGKADDNQRQCAKKVCDEDEFCKVPSGEDDPSGDRHSLIPLRKLTQETSVVLDQETDVFDPVLNHGETIESHSEGIASHMSGIEGSVTTALVD